MSLFSVTLITAVASVVLANIRPSSHMSKERTVVNFDELWQKSATAREPRLGIDSIPTVKVPRKRPTSATRRSQVLFPRSSPAREQFFCTSPFLRHFYVAIFIMIMTMTLGVVITDRSRTVRIFPDDLSDAPPPTKRRLAVQERSEELHAR